MVADEEERESLRQIFREELDDHLDVLASASTTLAREHVAPDERRDATLRIFRAAHGLKGAAQAVGYADLARMCHALESALGDMRGQPSSALPPEEVQAVTERTMESLRRWRSVNGRGPTRTVERSSQSDPPSRTSRTPTEPPTALPSTVRIASSRLNEVLVAADEVLADSLRAMPTDDTSELALREATLALEAVKKAPHAASRVLAHSESALRNLRLVELFLRQNKIAALSRDRTLRRRSGDLVLRVRRLRLVTLEALAVTLESTAVETAHQVGKRVELELVGASIEVDRRVVDELRSSLIHLVRNAVDHGIEPPEQRRAHGKPEVGRVVITASVRGRELEVVVEDDGSGLDEEALRDAASASSGTVLGLFDLASLPGVSTRHAVSAISGRGMGLEAVRHDISELHGRIRLESVRGRGSRFEIRVPVDRSVMTAFVVHVHDAPMAIPLGAVDRLIRTVEHGLRKGEDGFRVSDGDGSEVPYFDLATVLGFPAPAPSAALLTTILTDSEHRVAFAVDRFVEVTDLILRPLGERIRRLPFVTAMSLLPSGELIPVLDASALVRATRREMPTTREDRAAPRLRRVLIVDDSATARQVLSWAFEGAGYDVVTAADGIEALDLLDRGPTFDVVLSDVQMPAMDGMELLAAIVGHPSLSRLPVVLVTGVDGVEQRERALAGGARGYVIKSRFDPDGLIELVGSLIDESGE